MACVGALDGALLRPSEENPVRPVKPTLVIRGVGAYVSPLPREHVKAQGQRHGVGAMTLAVRTNRTQRLAGSLV